MTYIAPIRLAREAQLERRGGLAKEFAGAGGCRRRVERLRAIEHCSKVLLQRMFHTLPDAFRYFLAKGDAPSVFLSDAQLETCFITPPQLREGLNSLLLQAAPHPAPLSQSRRERKRESWNLDLDDILEEVTVGFRSQLALLDFMRMFEWDFGLGAETQLQIAVTRRHLQYQVRMEIKEKTIVSKWRFLSMAIRARVICWRWMYMMASFALNNWRAFTKASLERKRKEVMANAYACEMCARRFLEFWHSWWGQLKMERQQADSQGEHEAAAAQFLRRHPCIKTPSDAFLAGLTHGAAHVVCEDATPSKVSRAEGSLYQFVKRQPLRSSEPTPVPRPSSASPSLSILAPSNRGSTEVAEGQWGWDWGGGRPSSAQASWISLHSQVVSYLPPPPSSFLLHPSLILSPPFSLPSLCMSTTRTEEQRGESGRCVG